MAWKLSYRCDPVAASLADRHYSRQTIGSPQFVPPGRCMVLVSRCSRAVWVTSWPFAEYTRHQWAGAWVCSMFRNEGAGLSSELIRQAVAVTCWYHRNGPASWTTHREPELGMITFVWPAKIRSSNPGYCYQRAGWRKVGKSKELELPCFQLQLSEMPEPQQPIGSTASLLSALHHPSLDTEPHQ